MPKRSLVFWFLFLYLSSCYAGPPFLSDDAHPVDYRNYEIYLHEQSDKNHYALEIALPGIEFDYGVLENLEINATIRLIDFYPSVHEEHSAYGFGDIQCGFKYRFITETNYRPEVAFAPNLFLPTGNESRHLGNGRAIQQIPLWIQKNWNDWAVYGGGGYTIHPGTDNHNFWYGGVVAQHNFNDHWMGGLELYGQGANEKELRSFLLLNLGGSVNLNKNVSVLFSAGHSVVGEKHFVTYFAICVTGA